MAESKSNKDPFACFMARVQEPVPVERKSLEEISDRDLLHMLAVLLQGEGLGLSPMANIVAHLRYRLQAEANHG
jgi:hypothetical protein